MTAAGIPGRRVLVVEDESIVAMLLEDTLAELGYSVAGPVAHSTCRAAKINADTAATIRTGEKFIPATLGAETPTQYRRSPPSAPYPFPGVRHHQGRHPVPGQHPVRSLGQPGPDLVEETPAGSVGHRDVPRKRVQQGDVAVGVVAQ